MLGSTAWRPHRSLLLGAIALSVLLAVLATLQYRWLGQIGEADAARLRAGARSRAAQLGREFDREVTLAFLWLQADAGTVRGGDATAYAGRFSRWRRLAAQPGIVRAVYVVEGDRLRRFEPGTGAFVATEWPAELRTARERFRAVGRSPAAGAPPAAAGGGRGFFDAIDPDLPAIVAPAPEFGRRTPGSGGPGGGGGPGFPFRFAGFTVIQLDDACLRKRLLPSLVARHFAADGESDYGIRVDRQGSPADVVYTSDRAITADGPADATVGLFGIRLEDASESDLAGLPWPMPDGMRRRAGPSPFAGGRLPSFGGGAATGQWRLLARHRAGSVNAVVAAVRRRNLAVSGGVLALLLASAVLIVVSAQRARRLADRQVEFVAGVSHELRTPLAVICAAGDNLAAGVVTDPATAREYGRVVRDEGRRLAEMVERVLDLAGTYSGHRKWRFEDVDVEAVLTECVASLEPLARERGLGIESAIGGSLPRVRAERSALRRAVANLVQNAILHGGDGGFVGLRAEPSGPEGQRKIRITVEDRGPGIPASEVPHLFEPFFRGAEAVSTQTRGSGLGLSLVKRIVDAHGGAVEVRTVPGRGSTFTIVLPSVPRSRDDSPHTAG
jgi:signal transduction histidine kinase